MYPVQGSVVGGSPKTVHRLGIHRAFALRFLFSVVLFEECLVTTVLVSDIQMYKHLFMSNKNPTDSLHLLRPFILHFILCTVISLNCPSPCLLAVAARRKTAHLFLSTSAKMQREPKKGGACPSAGARLEKKRSWGST